MERDKTLGLSYHSARYLDTKTGRWLTPDPLYNDANILLEENPFESNLYSYVMGNPVNAKDESGEFLHILAGAGIGALIGGGVEFASQMMSDKPINVRKIVASTIEGAITGGAAVATGGLSLPVQGAAMMGVSAAGGMVNRGIDGDAGTEVCDPVSIGFDAALGGLSTVGAKKAGDLAERAIKNSSKYKGTLKVAEKNVRAVKQRSVSRQAPKKEALKKLQSLPGQVKKVTSKMTGKTIKIGAKKVKKEVENN